MSEKIIVLTKQGCGKCESLKNFIHGTKRLSKEIGRFEFIVKEEQTLEYNKGIREALADIGEITTLPVVMHKGKVHALGFSPSEVISLVENVKELDKK